MAGPVPPWPMSFNCLAAPAESSSPAFLEQAAVALSKETAYYPGARRTRDRCDPAPAFRAFPRAPPTPSYSSYLRSSGLLHLTYHGPHFEQTKKPVGTTAGDHLKQNALGAELSHLTVFAVAGRSIDSS